MKTTTFLFAAIALVGASSATFGGNAVNPSAPLNSRSEQIHLAPATHQPPGAGVRTSSVVGNNGSKKTPQHNHFDSSSSLPKPALPVNAGQQHVAIIGGPAMKTPHETGVINGSERRRSP